MPSLEQLAQASKWNDLAILRAGIRFTQRVGRPPRRLDFRAPAHAEWQDKLHLELPTADQAASRFGSWNAYLHRMGYGPHVATNPENHIIETAAIAHVEELYPGIHLVESEQNAWDAVHVFDPARGPERIEIKGSVLSRRQDSQDSIYWAFKTHGRILSKTVERLILVGLGFDQVKQVLIPMVRLEFPKTALRSMTDGKSTIMIYANSVFGASHTLYRPYIRWRNPEVSLQEVPRFLRQRKDKETA